MTFFPIGVILYVYADREGKYRRFEEAGDKCDIVLKADRAEADEAYKRIAVRINALAEVEGAAAYEPFVKPLNELIKKFAVKHRHRHGGAAEDAGEEADAVDAAPEAA